MNCGLRWISENEQTIGARRSCPNPKTTVNDSRCPSIRATTKSRTFSEHIHRRSRHQSPSRYSFKKTASHGGSSGGGGDGGGDGDDDRGGDLWQPPRPACTRARSHRSFSYDRKPQRGGNGAVTTWRMYTSLNLCIPVGRSGWAGPPRYGAQLSTGGPSYRWGLKQTNGFESTAPLAPHSIGAATAAKTNTQPANGNNNKPGGTHQYLALRISLVLLIGEQYMRGPSWCPTFDDGRPERCSIALCTSRPYKCHI